MAEYVQVVVNVDKSQLSTLKTDINSIKNTDIKIKIDNSGSEIKATAVAVNELGDSFQNTGKQVSFTGDVLGRIKWRAINAAIDVMARSIKQALTTMKAVDTELTNIQKVSNMTASELKEIGDAAYSTASKYGVAADEYLSAVYTFQKAGLGESATDMAELATKTMLVGDTTADVASKFLVAVNAAWELNGSMTDLSRVVDEADYINNNYATDLEKLSAGMPIVASTAANLNMSIEETLAVLGTITAKTQETGTKAATAWRALVMNITGELGEVTDETGETIEVTEQSVKSISDALRIYGNEAVQAAQNSGTLIDPMEAVISLAEAYKDGLLNDIELENILMNVGGKLRTNQLTALVKDLASETSTYYDIMANLPNAAGTADAEIETMLGSWEAKTQKLKNTWTEFVSHLIDTGTVKGALDVLTYTVEGLDGPLGVAAAAALGLAAAWKVVNAAIESSHPVLLAVGVAFAALVTVVGAIKSEMEDAQEQYEALVSSSRKLAESMESMETGMSQSTAEIEGVAEAADKLISKMESLEGSVSTSEVAQREYAAAVETLNSLVPTLGLKINEQTGLVDASTENIRENTAAWKENAIEQAKQNLLAETYQAYAKAQVELTKNQQKMADERSKLLDIQLDRIRIERELQQAGEAWYSIYNKPGERTLEEAAALEYYRQKQEDLQNELIEVDKRASDTRSEIETLDDAIRENTETLTAAKEELGLTEEALDALGQAADGATEPTEDFGRSVSDIVEDVLTLEDELGDATAAIEAFNEATKSEKGDVFSDYSDIYKKFLEDWEAGLHGTNRVKEAITALMGADAIAEYAGDWEALGEMLASDFWQGVFADGGEDYGANFMNALYEIADENGNVIDSNGEVVASFEAVGDALTLTELDVEGLADTLGTTPGVIKAVLEAWDAWSPALLTTKAEMLELAESLGALSEAGSSVDLTAFLEGLAADAKLSSADIWDLYNALLKVDGVDITNVPDDIAGIINRAGEAKDATDSARGALDDLDKTSAEPEIKADTTAFDRAISDVKTTLEELSATPTIVNIIEKTTKASAGGTDNAAGGETLVNEEGPEIIQEGDTARIAGGGEPTITDVKPGARIFTAEETQKILSGRSTFDILRAAADGISGATGPRYNSITNTQTTTATTTSRTPAATTTVTNAAALEELQQEIEDRYKTQLDLLKSQLELMEKQGASAEKRAGVIADIQSLLHGEADELRGIGASETDINKLSSEWYDYREEKIQAYRDEMEDRLALLKSELELMEDQGASAEARAVKIGEIQDLLHDEADFLRSVGASQAEINKLSSEWYDYREQKNKAHQTEIEAQISLRKSEFDLMEKRGASETEQIAKLKEVQTLLHQEAEFLRSIGASQEEINKLSEEWLDVQEQIVELHLDYSERMAQIVTLRESELGFLEESDAALGDRLTKMREIQNALHDEAEAIRATAEYQEAVRQAEEDEAGLTEDQVALLTRVKGLSKEWWTYQNKIVKEIEDADEALKKLISERFSKAQEEALAWIDAEEEAATKPFRTQLDALKEQKAAIEDAREEEEKLLAVEKARIALQNAENERNIRQYNAATGQWEWVANAQTVASARQSLADAERALADFYRDRSISSLEDNIKGIQSSYDLLRDAIKDFAKAIEDGTASYEDAASYLLDKMKGTGLEKQAETVGTRIETSTRLSDLEQMKANSLEWFTASDERKRELKDENLRLGTAQGWHRGDDGVWYKADGTRAYDSGGILRGLGGIKATREDEMILPPSMTSRLLDAEKSGAFDALLNHLGIVTAAAQRYIGFGGGLAGTSVGTQNNGDRFYFDGIEISNVTMDTTMGEFLQKVRTLPLYSGR